MRIPPTNYDAINFLIQQGLARVETCTIAKVVAVTNQGGIVPAGFVDVQPMINQTSGDGTMTPHGTVHRLPYTRIQGGTDAFIIDPKVNDIGIVVFASRDTNSVKNTRAQANPSSRRRFDAADGIYIGGILNGTPSQFIGYSENGIAITSPTAVTITAPMVKIISDDVEIAGTSLKHNSHNVGSTHLHTETQSGSGNSGPPQ